MHGVANSGGSGAAVHPVQLHLPYTGHIIILTGQVDHIQLKATKIKS